MKDFVETSSEVETENQTIETLQTEEQEIIVSDCRSAISETLVASEKSSPRKKLSPEVATLTSESLSQIKEEIHRLKTTKIKKHKLSKDVLQIIEIIFSATQKNEMITIEEISTITGRPPKEIQKFLYQWHHRRDGPRCSWFGFFAAQTDFEWYCSCFVRRWCDE